jgi:hypothetical protein
MMVEQVHALGRPAAVPRLRELPDLWLPLAVALSLPGLLPLAPDQAAMLFVGLTLLPLALYVSGKLGRFDTLMVVGLTYFSNFPLAFLTRFRTNSSWFAHLSESNVDYAMLWSYRGFACLIVGYLFSYRLFRQAASVEKKPRPRIHPFAKHNVTFIVLLGLLTTVAGTANILLHQGAPLVFYETGLNTGTGSRTLYVAVNYLYLLGVGSLFLMATFWRRGLRMRGVTALFSLNLCLYLVIAMGSGSKGAFMSLLVALAVPVFLEKARPSAKTFVVSALTATAVYGVFAVVGAYRDLVRSLPPPEGVGAVETIRNQLTTFRLAAGLSFDRATEELGLSPAAGYANETVADAAQQRLGSSLFEFASILQISDRISPYDNPFWTLLSPLITAVPRSLFPGKPTFFGPGDHARVYGWSYGGLSISLPGSLYWTWGIEGVCVGMGFLGLLLGYLTRRAGRRVRTAPTVGAVLVFQLILALLDTGNTIQAILATLTANAMILTLLYMAARVEEVQRVVFFLASGRDPSVGRH